MQNLLRGLVVQCSIHDLKIESLILDHDSSFLVTALKLILAELC